MDSGADLHNTHGLDGLGGFRAGMIILEGQHVVLHLRSSGPMVSRSEMRKWLVIIARFSELNKQPAALVQSRHDTRNYYITDTSVAKGFDQNLFIIKGQTAHMGDAIQPVVVDARRLDTRIPRPRNSFMLYRTWMSSKIIKENPGLTAGCISQIVSNMWRSEGPKTRAHFKGLAEEEDDRHRAMYPNYRYDVRRVRMPRLPPAKRHITHDPMTIAFRLIDGGY
ncbi:high mobility group box-domain-containing protein [Schizothecium vesticola]|uniref:High mobility group box-domain-containing protein n=1 Tax=Schizothecium vesticola TaxID=314040 RepID=A0AA40FA84_9PEZI|nr:high mobility group box-domain-containing protein [Schizothecium vesticola]